MKTFKSIIGRRVLKLSLGAVAVSVAAQLAQAGIIPYSTPGVENAITYTFTATASGDIVGYFAGTHASYTEEVGLSVNGGSVASWGLNNQTSAIGSSFNFGSVNAGDTLTFVLRVINPLLSPPYVYSDASLNAPFDGTVTSHNHIYSTSYAAGQIAGLPAALTGTYVAFEDLKASNPPDWNYFDDTFVFENVSTTVVPEPSTYVAGALMLLPFGTRAFRILRNKRVA